MMDSSALSSARLASQGMYAFWTPCILFHTDAMVLSVSHLAGVSDHDLLFSEKGAEPISQAGSGSAFPERPPPGQRTAQKPPAVGQKSRASAASKPG